MKKYEFEIAGLDCAACANEIQEGLNKNPEIKNANVNFAKMKLTYETDDISEEGKPFSMKSNGSLTSCMIPVKEKKKRGAQKDDEKILRRKRK